MKHPRKIISVLWVYSTVLFAIDKVMAKVTNWAGLKFKDLLDTASLFSPQAN